MKPKKKPRHDSHRFSEDTLVKNLSGYIDLGAQGEAIRIVKQILAQQRISPTAFEEAITAAGALSEPRKWIVQLEAAWNRQSRAFQRKTNSAMLMLYSLVNQWEKAARHAAPNLLCCPSDFLFGVEAFLRTGRTKEAARVARKARKLLESELSTFELGCLIEALASYHAWVGDRAEAFELWEQAPRDEPFGRNAALGRAELGLAQSLDIIAEELDVLRSLPLDLRHELMVPGNTDGMRKETEAELLKLKRALEKLLLPERRRELGVTESASTIDGP